MDTASALMGMVPWESDPEGEVVYLCRVGGSRFTEPFFDNSLDLLAPIGQSQTAKLTFPELREAVGLDVPSPRALVFHTGRCGSTLLTRMLAHDRAVLSVSEPGSVSTIHRDAIADAARADADRQAIADLMVLFDRFAAGRRQRPVFKLSSWETPDCASVVALAPDVPLIFVHRPVAEVVASLVSGLPAWAKWLTPETPGLRDHAAHVAQLSADAPTEEFFAALWASSVAAVLGLTSRTLFVSYADLVGQPAETLAAVAQHIGLTESWSNGTATTELRYYAKSLDPSEPFDPEERHARAPLSPDALERVLDVVGDLPDTLAERTETSMRQS